MGLRFRKSLKIAPGVRLNVGTKGMGLSVGGKGFRYSINTSGRRTTSIGIPGSGLSYSTLSGGSRRKYNSSSYQKRSQLAKLEREIQKANALKRAQHEVEVFQNKIDVIKSIHKECDDFVDWHDISQTPSPFQEGEKGKNELDAIRKYNDFKPNFFQRLFKLEPKIREKLNHQISIAKNQDAEEYKQWKDMNDISKKVLEGDVDTYLAVIDEMSPLDDLLEFGSGFEFFAEEPEYIEVDFDVHIDQVIPNEEKRLTSTGKLSTKQMSKTNYYDLAQDYVCSCVIRIARDMFAILPLQTIYIHAFDDILDTSTGHINRKCILSVKMTRSQLNQLNFDLIDCSDAISNFEHHMKFRKTKGFDVVEKLEINHINQ
jgi:hypothetical protein